MVSGLPAAAPVPNVTSISVSAATDGTALQQAATGSDNIMKRRVTPKSYAMGEMNCGPSETEPPIMWEDIALLLQGAGPLVAEGEREHAMTTFEKPRRLFAESRTTRRKPGGDKWSNSGGKKGSTVYWVRPGLGVRKRYGSCVAINHKELCLRYAEFKLVHGTCDAPVCGTNGPSVFVLNVGWQQSLRPCAHEAELPTLLAPPQPRVDDAELRVPAIVGAPAGVPHIFEGVPIGESDRAAVIDLVQQYGRKFMSFQAKDDGKLIELGTVEKGACGVTLSSTQGDFAEWHRRVSTEPPLHEGDVIGFTARGEITRHCSTSAKMLLGVVSRKAVVEGSAPSIAERDLYDTVAYCGVVPVRVVPRVANDIILGVPAMSTCTTRCGGEIFDAAINIKESLDDLLCCKS